MRDSIESTAGGGLAFIAQVTLYSATLCVAISQAFNLIDTEQALV